jgi:hypothetical protein
MTPFYQFLFSMIKEFIKHFTSITYGGFSSFRQICKLLCE